MTVVALVIKINWKQSISQVTHIKSFLAMLENHKKAAPDSEYLRTRRSKYLYS